MSQMFQHEQYIFRCIQLAKLGGRWVSKNPLVGSVLVNDNRIIGEGYHQKYGEAHAEVNCLKSVSDSNRHLIPASTLYVTLEPCNHTGKTPPCSHAIVDAGIKKVIVGTKDINPLVAGAGIKFLQKNNVEVEVGFCESECLKLNRVFFTNQKEKRAYIKLKWAQSANGYLGEKGKQTPITNDYVNILNHKYRTKTDSILVGYNTAKIDTPSLTSRNWKGKQPARIFLDWNCELDKVLTSEPNSRTIILNSKKNSAAKNIEYHQIEKSPQAIAEKLYELAICSVIIEGGAKTHNLFIKENLWDETVIIHANTMLTGDCVTAAKIDKGIPIAQHQLSNNQIKQFSNSEFLK